MSTTSIPLMTRGTRWAAPLSLAAVLLTGCTGEAGPEPEAAVSQEVPTPTQISQPADDQACTVELETTEGAEHPDRATVTCGDTERTVAGDFRHQVTNDFDPATASGIQRVLIVGDSHRAWMDHPEGACVIAWQEGDPPVECEPIVHQDADEDTATEDEEPLTPEGLAEQDA